MWDVKFCYNFLHLSWTMPASQKGRFMQKWIYWRILEYDLLWKQSHPFISTTNTGLSAWITLFVIYVSISVIVWIQWALNANIIDGTFKIRLKWAVQIRSRHRRRNRYFFLVKHNKTIAIYLLLSVLVRSINSCYFEK